MCKNSNGVSKARAEMAKTCSDSPDPRAEGSDSCTCIPTRIVEDDLEIGINPLGRDRAGCVEVEEEMIFKDLTGR